MAVDRCRCTHQIDPACRFCVTQSGGFELIAGRGLGGGARQQGCIFLGIGSDGFFDHAGIDPVGSTPAEFKAFLVADRERFLRMFQASGLKPE